MKIAPDGAIRSSDRYIVIGREGSSRPDPVQAAWVYAQIVRWGQAPLSDDLLASRKRFSGPISMTRRSALRPVVAAP